MISLLPFALSVSALREDLNTHPEVWDQYRWRTEHPQSPHREVSDIWCRYNALENMGPHFNDEHESVWYPVIDKLPAVKSLCNSVMALQDNHNLAGVLITKIPARAQVYPHVDFGWHAQSTEKIGVLVQGNTDQTFCFENAALRCRAGDCFTFNNSFKHWVKNDSAEDRITLIVCLRSIH